MARMVSLLALSLIMYAALAASAVVPDARYSCASGSTNPPWKSRTLVPNGYFNFRGCTFSGNNMTSTGVCKGTCNKGYSGAITVTCTNNKWDTPTGSCVANKKCFGFPQPGGAAKFPTSCRGKTTGFVCKSKDGASCSTCSARGKWMNVTACGGAAPSPSPSVTPSPSPNPGGNLPANAVSWQWCPTGEIPEEDLFFDGSIIVTSPFTGVVLLVGNAAAREGYSTWCTDTSSSGPGLLVGDTATCKDNAFQGFIALPLFGSDGQFDLKPGAQAWLESVDVTARGPGKLTFSNWENAKDNVVQAVAAGTASVKLATPLKYMYSEGASDVNVMLWAPDSGSALTVKCFRGKYVVPA